MNVMKCLLIVLLILISSGAMGANFYNGSLEVRLDKNELKSQEALSGVFIVQNSDAVNFYDGEIIAHVVSGRKENLGYPSQLGDDGVIFIEKKFPFRLSKSNTIEVPFEIPILQDLAPGKYTLDAYAKTKISPIVGVAHLFLNPVSAEFEVDGSGKFPQLNIVRTKTVFNDYTGPVGVPTIPGSEIKGKVFLQNTGEKRAVEVWAGLCLWDDTSCEEFLSENSKIVQAATGESSVDIFLEAPKIPSAYAVRIELRDGGTMAALYRNRIIVTGPGAKIKQYSVSTPSLKKGKTTQLLLRLGSSPDHYSKFDTADIDVRAWIENEGSKIFEQTRHIDLLKFDEVERQLIFEYNPGIDLNNFKVCGEISKGQMVYDTYCFDVVPLQDTRTGRGRIEIETNFDEAFSELNVDLCGFDAKDSPEAIDASIVFMDRNTLGELKSENIRSEGCANITLPVERKKYLLLIDDLKNNIKGSKEFDFTATQNTCAGLGGILCSSSETCEGTISGSQENCCIGICKGKGSYSVDDLPEQDEQFPFVYIIAGSIILLVLVFIVLSSRRQVS